MIKVFSRVALAVALAMSMPTFGARADGSHSSRQVAKFEVFAQGICECVDGRCTALSCSSEVGSSLEIELAKNRLRLELEAKARSLQGRLRDIHFSVRLKAGW